MAGLPVPPVIDTDAVPSQEPLHVSSVLFIFKTKGRGSVITTESVIVQPKESVTVKIYVPGQRLEIDLVPYGPPGPVQA